MPAATNRDELLAVTRKDYDKLKALIEGIEPEMALHKDEDDTSIKDVIAHRAHWIGLFFGWYEDGLAEREVHFPAKGYNWGDLKRYNAQLRESQAQMSWDDAKSALAREHEKLVNFIESHDDAALYDGSMKGARNDWTPGRWAEAAGPSHYRSAAKYIRARLRKG